MTRYLLLILFVAMLGGRALGLDFGLAPGLSIKNFLLYVAASTIAIESALAGNRRIEGLPVILPFGLLIAYALMTWMITVLILDNPNYAPVGTLIRLKTKLVDQFLMLLVFFYGTVNQKDALWLLKALVWVIVIGCLVTVVDTFNVPDLGIITASDKDGRVEGIIGSAAEFAALLAFFLPAIVALWWTDTGLRKSFALVGTGLTLVCVMLAATRGAMVGIVAGAILAAIYLRRYLSAQIVVRATMGALVVTAITALVILSTDFSYVLETRLETGLATGNPETISSGRTAIWSVALHEMAERPMSIVTGFGWEAYYQRIGHRYATHSVYLDRLYNLGIIGLLLTVITFTNTIAIARRGLRHASEPITPFLVATIIGMMAYMISIAFADLELAAIYVWAYMGLALRIVVSLRADTSMQSSPQRPSRPLSSAQAKPTTRPMSVTPKR